MQRGALPLPLLLLNVKPLCWFSIEVKDAGLPASKFPPQLCVSESVYVRMRVCMCVFCIWVYVC